MIARARQSNVGGFSLLEIAIVLVIVSILLSIVVVPLSSQMEQQRTAATNKQLEAIKEALIGFAIANGRLPCPAISTSLGAEKFAATGTAANGICQQFVGFLPAVTLGLTPVDSEGFAVDAWGLAQNRIRYAVMDISTKSTSPPTPFSDCPASDVQHVLTQSDGMKKASMTCLAKYSETTTPYRTLLSVCSQTPANAAPFCFASNLTITAPFVLISLGKNAATGGVGADESFNAGTAGGGVVFVSHTPTQAGTTGGEFDDIVTWGSLNTLFARMVQAGKLP